MGYPLHLASLCDAAPGYLRGCHGGLHSHECQEAGVRDVPDARSPPNGKDHTSLSSVVAMARMPHRCEAMTCTRRESKRLDTCQNDGLGSYTPGELGEILEHQQFRERGKSQACLLLRGRLKRICCAPVGRFWQVVGGTWQDDPRQTNLWRFRPNSGQLRIESARVRGRSPPRALALPQPSVRPVPPIAGASLLRFLPPPSCHLGLCFSVSSRFSDSLRRSPSLPPRLLSIAWLEHVALLQALRMCGGVS